jgi:hypothetical protein
MIIFLVAAEPPLYAQEGVEEIPRCPTSQTSGSGTKSYRHELRILSICIPETLVRRKTKSCGDDCFIFENDDLYFDADLSVSAFRPTVEKKYPSYSAVNKLIDGRTATIWYFEDKGNYKYVSGVNIVLERGRIGMGIYLFSKTADAKPIADRMFNSIKFGK